MVDYKYRLKKAILRGKNIMQSHNYPKKSISLAYVRYALINTMLFVAGFMISGSVRASLISSEKPTGIFDIVRQEMTKKAEPNKPVQSAETVQLVKSDASAELVESVKPLEPAKIRKDETQTKEHILHFPKDHSIGQLYIQDEVDSGKINSYIDWTESNREWESFAQAKGDVKIPAGKRVSLHITKDYVNNASALSKLLPDDLYRLVIAGSHPDNPVQRPLPDDKCVPYITGLTKLKDLHLSYTNISTKGLSLLGGFKSLDNLTLAGGLIDEELRIVSEQFKTLKSLRIGENRLTDKGLAYLEDLSSLERLEIVVSGRLTGDCLVHLAKLPSLRYLMPGGTNLNDDAMVYLKDIPSLRILDARSLTNLTDAALVHIGEIRNLEALNLHWSKNITDDGIEKLSKLKSLKKLDINNSRVTDKGLSYLISCKNLEDLTLPYKGISDIGLNYISQMSTLKLLGVGRSHFTNPNMDTGYYTDKGIAELANCKLLESLSIGSLGMTDESMRYIGELKNLKNLSIVDSNFTEKGMSQIANLTKLKQLNFYYCSNLTNKSLAKLAALKSLQSLEISFANITVGGLSRLNELPNLIHLHLGNVHQDDGGMDISKLINLEDLSLTTMYKRIDSTIVYDKLHNSDLACLAKLSKLKRVQLPGYGLDDNALKYFSNLTNLEFLNVYCAGELSITDEGVKQLASLPKLDRLMIKDGHFTDKSLEYLSGMPALNWLELTSDFAFGNKTIANFQAKNPNVEHLQLIP